MMMSYTVIVGHVLELIYFHLLCKPQFHNHCSTTLASMKVPSGGLDITRFDWNFQGLEIGRVDRGFTFE